MTNDPARLAYTREVQGAMERVAAELLRTQEALQAEQERSAQLERENKALRDHPDNVYEIIAAEQRGRVEALTEAGCERDPSCMEPPVDKEKCIRCEMMLTEINVRVEDVEPIQRIVKAAIRCWTGALVTDDGVVVAVAAMNELEAALVGAGQV